jgi:hypothetical protein
VVLSAEASTVSSNTKVMVASPMVLKSTSNATNVGRVASAAYAFACSAKLAGMALIPMPLVSAIAPNSMDKKVSPVDVNKAWSCLMAFTSFSSNVNLI